jgi:hypothetical protein
MRRLELLVQEVRDSSDSNDLNSYSIYELMRYFNDAQKLIQKIIFTNNSGTSMFNTFLDQDTQPNGVVPFPTNVYGYTAFNSVGFIRPNGYFSKLSKVDYAEFDNLYGYTIIDDYIVVPEKNSTDRIRINYVYELPVMSYRLGKVASIDPVDKKIVLDGATLISDSTFDQRYEYYSVVDAKGAVKASGLLLDALVGLEMDFDDEADFGTLAVGDWVVCGEVGSSHSKLPSACEPFLLSYVQRRVKDKISTSDKAGEQYFTQEERSDLEDLFSDNSKDQKYPPQT